MLVLRPGSPQTALERELPIAASSARSEEDHSRVSSCVERTLEMCVPRLRCTPALPREKWEGHHSFKPSATPSTGHQ